MKSSIASSFPRHVPEGEDIYIRLTDEGVVPRVHKKVDEIGFRQQWCGGIVKLSSAVDYGEGDISVDCDLYDLVSDAIGVQSIRGICTCFIDFVYM